MGCLTWSRDPVSILLLITGFVILAGQPLRHASLGEYAPVVRSESTQGAAAGLAAAVSSPKEYNYTEVHKGTMVQ